MDDWKTRWEIAEAEWVVNGAIVRVDLPKLATDALADDCDSPSLRLLAAGSTTDARDLRDLFLSAVDQVGRELPARVDAKWRLIRAYAADIDADRIAPVPGAVLISRLGYDPDDPDDIVHQTGIFAGLEDEWEGGWGRVRSDVEADIRAEARRVSAQEGPLSEP